jgi:hypothetical protein
MKKAKFPPFVSVFLCLVYLSIMAIHCKKSSTAPPVDPPAQEQTAITLTCSPSSGVIDTNFSVTIAINNSDREIKVFGLEVTFDADLFDFRRIEDGDLTDTWAAVDGNEIKKGILRVGGFMGSGIPIALGTTGTLAVVKFKVTGNNFNDGQQSQICIKNYTDDIVGLTPLPSCTNFTLRK